MHPFFEIGFYDYLNGLNPKILRVNMNSSWILILFLSIGIVAVPFGSSGQPISKQQTEAQLNPAFQVAAPSHEIAQQDDHNLPTVDAGDLLGQASTGILVGGVSAFLGGIIATQISTCEGWCELGEFIIGGSVGYIGGSSLMVHSYGNNQYQKASYPAVLLGDILGLGIGALTLSALAESKSKVGRILGGVAFFTFPVGGAMAGYYLTRQPTEPTTTTSLINISQQKASVSIPSFSVTSHRGFTTARTGSVVSLISIQL
ncbi:MAG: hypothetical protein U5K69_22215 [Balneolaceae bacterium]|nr:hypothetical protein [Balneolaceae bacterium]